MHSVSRKNNDNLSDHCNNVYCLANSGEPDRAIEYLEKYPMKDARLLKALAHYYDTFAGNEEKAMHYWKGNVEIGSRAPLGAGEPVDIVFQR